MNRGAIGARSLNVELQKVLNPRPPQAIHRFGTTFAIGDEVIQIENDYDKDVYNGDIGFMVAIDDESRAARRSRTVSSANPRVRPRHLRDRIAM